MTRFGSRWAETRAAKRTQRLIAASLAKTRFAREHAPALCLRCSCVRRPRRQRKELRRRRWSSPFDLLHFCERICSAANSALPLASRWRRDAVGRAELFAGNTYSQSARSVPSDSRPARARASLFLHFPVRDIAAIAATESSSASAAPNRTSLSPGDPWHRRAAMLQHCASATKCPSTRPVLARTSSAASGLRFWGMIEGAGGERVAQFEKSESGRRPQHDFLGEGDRCVDASWPQREIRAQVAACDASSELRIGRANPESAPSSAIDRKRRAGERRRAKGDFVQPCARIHKPPAIAREHFDIARQ